MIKINITDKTDFARLKHRYNKHHVPKVKLICAQLYMHVNSETLILIRLHKKADLMSIYVNCTNDRKVYADEN